MPWEYLEDGVTSDVTFRAWGRDLDELFTAAADATAGTMVEDPAGTIEAAVRLPITTEGPALDLLLMRFLDEMIFYKDARGLILRAGNVRVAGAGNRYTVEAELYGEPIDPAKHALAADVKAVTLCGLRVEHADSGWQAQVTLDV